MTLSTCVNKNNEAVTNKKINSIYRNKTNEKSAVAMLLICCLIFFENVLNKKNLFKNMPLFSLSGTTLNVSVNNVRHSLKIFKS